LRGREKQMKGKKGREKVKGREATCKGL